MLEQERLKAEEIVREEIAKTQIEIAAEAEAERQRRIAQGEADAILARYQAEAEGIKQVLEAKATGYQGLVASANGDAKAAATLLMGEKVDAMGQAQVEAVKNLKIDKITVWDSGNGSAGKVMEEISRKIKGQQILLFKEIDGNFPNHHPDPSDPENLVQCIAEIKKNNFDLGIAFDGDGDRIGVIDDKGRIIAGDILLLILSKSLVKKNSTIIGDVKCSQVLFDEIENLGGKPIISQTGHSHVKINMKKYDADLAGEMSGHIFFKSNYGFDDALYAAVQLIKILSNSKKKLSEHIDNIPKVFNTPEIRIDCEDDKKFTLINNISKSQKKLNKKIVDIDGLRVQSEDGWWLLRASNTQPCIVLRCESISEVVLKNQLLKVKEAVKEFDIKISQKIVVEN